MPPTPPVDYLADFAAILHALAPVGASFGGGVGLWKIVEKLIDVFEKRRESREKQDGATNAELRAENTKLHEQNLTLAKEAAAAAYQERLYTDAVKQRDAAMDRSEAFEKQMGEERAHFHREEQGWKNEFSQLRAGHDFLLGLYGEADTETIEFLKRKQAERVGRRRV